MSTFKEAASSFFAKLCTVKENILYCELIFKFPFSY